MVKMNKVIFCGMMPVLLLFFSRKYIRILIFPRYLVYLYSEFHDKIVFDLVKFVLLGIYPDNALFHQLTHNQLSNKPSSLLMKIKPTHELDKFTGRLIYKIDL